MMIDSKNITITKARPFFSVCDIFSHQIIYFTVVWQTFYWSGRVLISSWQVCATQTLRFWFYPIPRKIIVILRSFTLPIFCENTQFPQIGRFLWQIFPKNEFKNKLGALVCGKYTPINILNDENATQTMACTRIPT